LVKLHSTGINPIDTYIRAGTFYKPNLPFTPGLEGAGEVAGVGEGVNHVKVGDRVWINGSLTGTYAQYCLSLEKNVHHLSQQLSFDQGAALWIAYATSYLALHYIIQTKPNSKILIHGASGGVGIASLQLCKRIEGSFILGTAGTEKGLNNLTEQGAHAVFNHRKDDYMQEIVKATQGTGVDIVLEMMANVNLDKDLNALAKCGRVIVIGCKGPIEINYRELLLRRASIHGVALYESTPEEFTGIVEGIQKACSDKVNPLQPLIGKSYKLEEASKAHHEIINPPNEGAYGKLVFHPWD